MRMLRVPVQIVFYKDENDWIAHCLQFDVCGHGVTKQEALECLSEAVRIQVEDSLKNNNTRNLFSPADSEFFRMFAAGKDIGQGELKIDFQTIDSVVMENPVAREYSESDLIEI